MTDDFRGKIASVLVATKQCDISYRYTIMKPHPYSSHHSCSLSPISILPCFAQKLIDRWRFVPGDTIMFDFVYFIHPTAIGHCWEMLGPMFSPRRHSRGHVTSSSSCTSRCAPLDIYRGAVEGEKEEV